MSAMVLLPLDGSDKDARALAIAGAVARLADAAVHLLYVVPPDGAGDGAVEARLRAAAAALVPQVPGEVTWEVAAATDAAQALLRRAAELDAALVVMATRAPGPVGRAVLGSVADQVVRESACPVVLVPPGDRHAAGKQVRIERVLVPLDEATAARDMVGFLLGLPHTDELEYVLLQVVPTPPAARLHLPAAEHAHGAAERAERRLEGIADRLRERGARAEVRVIEAEDPAAIIADAVRQELVDCIAISTRGTHGLERWVMGSVADGVLRRAEVPVLLRTPK